MTVLERGLKTCQILMAAVMAGAIAFAAVTVFMVQSGHIPPPAPGGNLDVLKYVVPAVGVGAFLGVVFIRSRVAKHAAGVVSQLRDEEAIAAAIAESFSKVTILTCALMEGPALLAIVATLITGKFEFLAGTTACLIVMAVMFPTSGLLDRWAQRVGGPRY